MSSQENKMFISQYFEALKGAKPDELVNMYTTDEDLKQHIALFESAFPHYVVLAEDMIAEGDKVAVLARFKGTHLGDLMGIAATHKQVDLPFIIIYRIAHGKIVEHWKSVDQMSLMKQLGVVE
jgi:predicted ester cyclase